MSRELADEVGREGVLIEKEFLQIGIERRGSRRLPQIRAQIAADFLIGVK
jgi:hypothetical protein